MEERKEGLTELSPELAKFQDSISNNNQHDQEDEVENGLDERREEVTPLLPSINFISTTNPLTNHDNNNTTRMGRSKFQLLIEEEEDSHHPSAHTKSNSWKNLWGFYSYSFASEVFAIVSISMFIPITLEQLAYENGYRLPNHELPCSGSRLAGFTNTNDTSSSSSSTFIQNRNSLNHTTTCEVRLLGRWIDTSSFPLYVFSISVALQAFLVASLGDAADHIPMRKLLLVSCATIGSIAGMFFFFLDSTSSTWSFSAILAIISNAALGVSTVCLNSYIPNLAKTSPKVLSAERKLMRRIDTRITTTAEEEGEEGQEEEEEYKTLVSKTTSEISSKGIAIGFGFGVIALSVSLFPIISHNGSTDSLQSSIGYSALWWAVFTVPAAIWLPPIGTLDFSSVFNPFNPMKNYRHIVAMFSQYNQLKNTIIFLMAWFLLSDAFSTLISTAILFGKTELKMPPSHLILIGIITPTTGIIGALITPLIQRNLKVYSSDLNGSLKIFKILIGCGSIVPSYVTFTIIFQLPGLTTEIEMFLACTIFGLSYGAFQSYARSVYAELIPPGQEAKWYALYSITDKSSSFFGPFIVGIIADYTHNIRYGFIFILLILCLSFPLLNRVDIPIGKLKALKFSQQFSSD